MSYLDKTFTQTQAALEAQWSFHKFCSQLNLLGYGTHLLEHKPSLKVETLARKLFDKIVKEEDYNALDNMPNTLLYIQARELLTEYQRELV